MQGITNLAQFKNFERFRRSLRDPDVITFDELCLRATLALAMAGPDADAGALEAGETDCPHTDDAPF
jgi:hypothetical protein